jgi:hypothetical protein
MIIESLFFNQLYFPDSSGPASLSQ